MTLERLYRIGFDMWGRASRHRWKDSAPCLGVRVGLAAALVDHIRFGIGMDSAGIQSKSPQKNFGDSRPRN
jgi:hypothetical protein